MTEMVRLFLLCLHLVSLIQGAQNTFPLFEKYFIHEIKAIHYINRLWVLRYLNVLQLHTISNFDHLYSLLIYFRLISSRFSFTSDFQIPNETPLGGMKWITWFSSASAFQLQTIRPHGDFFPFWHMHISFFQVFRFIIPAYFTLKIIDQL